MAHLDQDLFRRMQEAALRFRSGESDFEEIMTPNGPAHLVRDPSNSLGFRIDFVAGSSKHSVSIQEYPPAPGRPHGYPAPLPFLANCRTTVNTLDQAVTWHDVDDVAAAVALVVEQCVSEGWSVVESRANPESRRLHTFAKEGVERTLDLVDDDGPPRLVMVERRDGSGQQAPQSSATRGITGTASTE